MGSITSWLRLEPRCRDDEMTEGLRARMHDPLWMLARQWQVGEFRAEDAGSPVLARWRAESAPLTRLHLGAIAPNTNETAARYDVTTLPLEAIVERQRARAADAFDASGSLRLAVESGLQLLRLVDAQPTTKKYRAAFIKLYALAAPTGADTRRTRCRDDRVVVADGGPRTRRPRDGRGLAPCRRIARAAGRCARRGRGRPRRSRCRGRSLVQRAGRALQRAIGERARFVGQRAHGVRVHGRGCPRRRG